MTHSPPLPDAALAPWPAHPAPRTHDGEAATAAHAAATVGDAGRSRRNTIAGVAMGIGSAAIVAALLYANRGKAQHAQNPQSDLSTSD